MKHAAALWTSALDLLFPPRCQVCGDLQAPPLCAPCRETIAWLHPPWCVRCGFPFDPRARGAPECRACRSRKGRSFAAARSAAAFQGTLRTAIHRFKYGGQRNLAQPLGELMLEFVKAQPEAEEALALAELDFIIPVPLHTSRHQRRGFNQSELLAQVLGAHWGIGVRSQALVRARATLPQVQLPREERQRNVREAFVPAPDLEAPGATALLVDDLLTTGATVRECARALHRKQIARVFVYTLARAI